MGRMNDPLIYEQGVSVKFISRSNQLTDIRLMFKKVQTKMFNLCGLKLKICGMHQNVFYSYDHKYIM